MKNAYAPELSAKDADLLKDLLTSARTVSVPLDGERERYAMAELICHVLGLDERTFREVIVQAIAGNKMLVHITEDVTL